MDLSAPSAAKIKTARGVATEAAQKKTNVRTYAAVEKEALRDAGNAISSPAKSPCFKNRGFARLSDSSGNTGLNFFWIVLKEMSITVWHIITRAAWWAITISPKRKKK